MIVYRLCRSKYARDLSGSGAEKAGGRWNSKGVPMLYTSSSRALCTIEIAVHVSIGIIPEDYQVVEIEIPDTKPYEPRIANLPSGWNIYPPSSSSQAFGDAFIAEGKHLVMKVPSVSVEEEFNYLINPRHKDFKNVKIKTVKAFGFDSRLFAKR